MCFMCKLTFKFCCRQLWRAALSATTHPTPHHRLSLDALIRRAAWRWGIGQCGGWGTLSLPLCTSRQGGVTGGERCSQPVRLRLPNVGHTPRSVRGLEQPQCKLQFENKLQLSLIIITIVILAGGTLNPGKKASLWCRKQKQPQYSFQECSEAAEHNNAPDSQWCSEMYKKKYKKVNKRANTVFILTAKQDNLDRKTSAWCRFHKSFCILHKVSNVK